MGDKNNKSIMSLILKNLVIVIGGVGLILNFKMNDFSIMILYFTIISNMAVVLTYIVDLIMIAMKKESKVLTNIKQITSFSIVVTMIMYWTMYLFKTTPDGYETHMTACRFVHLYLPLACVIENVFSNGQVKLEPWRPFMWVSLIFLYQAFVMIYSALGGVFGNGSRFAYEFMDYTKYGYGYVIFSTIGFYTVLVAIGYIYVIINNKCVKRGK